MAKHDEWKNIVIIGASFGGHSLANKLRPLLPPNYRILLIDRTPFAAHLPALVRTVVVPGSESKKFTAPLEQDTVFAANAPHRLLCPATVLELRAGSVLLDTEFEGSDEVSFERCILATGSSQTPPFRPVAGSSVQEYRSLLRSVQGDIGRAESVLIVGGGASGVEIAGEITSHYPDKKVILVHSRDKLLVTGDTLAATSTGGSGKEFSYTAPPERVSNELEAQLRVRGVDIALGDRVVFPEKSKANGTKGVSAANGVDVANGANEANGASVANGTSEANGVDDKPTAGTSTPNGWDGTMGALPALHAITLRSGRVVHADYVLLSTGNSPNSSLVATADPAAVSSTGYVTVDPEFRIVSTSPILHSCYAVGDVATTHARKTAGQAVHEGWALATILAEHIKAAEAGRAPKARPYKMPTLEGCMIPLGDGKARAGRGDGIGSGALTLGWLGTWRVPNWMLRWFAKEYFASQNFFPRFKGPKKVDPEA